MDRIVSGQVRSTGRPELISALHDRLYAGRFNVHLRSDIPFVPHMTVGAARDRASALTLANELDSPLRTVRGSLEALELVDVGTVRVRSIARYGFGLEHRPPGQTGVIQA